MNEKPESEWSAADYFHYAATGKKPTTQEDNDMTDDNPGDFGGLTFGEFKRHPITRLLRNVQAGQVPTVAEIDALALGPRSRGRLQEAINGLRELRDAGERGQAHKVWDRLAADVVSQLPEAQRDPGYLADPDDNTPSDPAALAAQVARY